MSNDRDLDNIFDRIAKRNATDEDIQTLRQLLRVTEGQSVIQIGKYSVNITEGREIHIGDRIYQSTDAETIRVIVLQVLAEKNRDDTFQRLFSQSESSLVDWGWGLKLLEQKQLPEIRKRLTDTLGRDRILMDVSIEEQRNWVNRSPLAADRTLQINGEDCGRLDANKMLIETFGRDDIEGKLLILGAPGAGKTTALLSLAEQLVYGAISQPRTVIPVIFELSTWQNDNQSIQDWLIEQLYDLHGGNRKSKLYEQWLERQVLLPLLDGLDELGLERQKKCTEKLNEFAEQYPQMVVCCRVKEFEAVDIKLRNLRGAVCLQSLSDSQIQHYLDTLQRPELWEAIQTTPSLQAMLEPTTEGDPGLLRVPLFVKLVVDVYDPQQPISSKADLLDKYIDRQLSFDKREIDRRKELNRYKWSYENPTKEPSLKETSVFLRWLARYLKTNSQINFLIEQIQPNILTDHFLNFQYLFFIMLICLILSAITLGLIVWGFWLVAHNYNNPGMGLKAGFILGLIVGIQTIIEGRLNLINSVAKISFSFFIRKEVIARFHLSFGISIFLLYLLKFHYWYLDALFFAIIIALSFTGSQIEMKICEKPNQGIMNSLINTFLVSLISYPLIVFILMSESIINVPDVFQFKLTLYSMIGLFLALNLGFHSGGRSWIQHLALRAVIYFNFPPVQLILSRFLNYCVERRLLLRVGGSYRFLHRELLDHFAQSNR